MLIDDSCSEDSQRARVDPGGGAIGTIDPPKTYESKFIHHDYVQFRKQHSRLKAILSSIVLPQ